LPFESRQFGTKYEAKTRKGKSKTIKQRLIHEEMRSFVEEQSKGFSRQPEVTNDFIRATARTNKASLTTKNVFGGCERWKEVMVASAL
jgi:hypothetical protein